MVTIDAIKDLRIIVREIHHLYKLTIHSASDRLVAIRQRMDYQNFYHLILVTEGEVNIHFDASKVELTQGGVAIVPSNAKISNIDGTGYIISFRIDSIDESPGLEPLFSYTSEQGAALQLLAKSIIDLNDLKHNPLEYRLRGVYLHSILGMIYKEIKHPWEKNFKSKQITKVCELIKSNPTTRYSLESLSTKCNMSLFHFSHLFKENTGTSPTRYIIETRCNYAEQLIKITDKSLKEIAFDCGYPDQYSFSKQFKKIMGIPPTYLR